MENKKKIVDLSTTISVIMLNVYGRGVPVSAQLYTVNYRASLFKYNWYAKRGDNWNHMKILIKNREGTKILKKQQRTIIRNRGQFQTW